ncbi:insulinase family protein [Imtechella halotolerans]|nr:insulinase family protein [Imtechella halotolerans]WMQ64740.1 insulinase family protein [Imtechella halotolerans]
MDSYFFKTKLESLLFPCLNNYSDFFEHNNNFSWKSLHDYYKKWYRPDLMAVVVIGKIEKINDIENQIQNYFSSLKSPKYSPPSANCFKEYFYGENKFLVLEKPKSISDNKVNVKLNIRDIKTIHNGDYKSEIIWGMITKVLNNRFKEQANSYNEDFVLNFHPPTRVTPIFQINFKTRNNEIPQSLNKAIYSIEQLKKFGFNLEEWEDIIRSHFSNAPQQYFHLQPEYWLEQISNHFIYEDNLAENKPEKIKQWLSEITLDEINNIIKEYLTSSPNDIAVSIPNGFPILEYNEEQFNNWILQAKKIKVSPFKYPNAPKQLLSNSEVAKLKNINFIDYGTNKFGTYEIQLNNGVKVAFQSVKPTISLNQNRIMFHGFSKKGASIFPKEDYFSAINAPLIIRNAGVGEIDKYALSRYLKGTSFNKGIFPYVHYNETGIRGNVMLKDLESFLQLVYLYFTNPRKDSNAFENWKKDEEKRHQSPTYNDLIQEDFNVEIRQFLGDSTVVFEGTKRLNGIEETDMDRAYKIYQQLYGDASEFTFLISGDFQIKSVLPMIQKYLGNLPMRHQKTEIHPYKKNKVHFINPPIYHMFSAQNVNGAYEMKSIKYNLRFITQPENPLGWKEKIKVELLGLLMNEKIKKLRFSRNAALYYLAAYGRYNSNINSYELGITLDCIKEEIEMIRYESKNIIEQIKKGGFTTDEFKFILDSYLNSSRYNVNHINKNEQIILNMYNFYRHNITWKNNFEEQQFIRSLTKEDLQKTAQKYLNKNKVMEFLMI